MNFLENIGYQTAHGEMLGVKDHWLWMYKGRRIAQIELRPLQWKLLAAGIKKTQRDQSVVTVENEEGRSVKTSKGRAPQGITLTIKGQFYELTTSLYSEEVDMLLEAAYLRCPHQVTTT